MGGVCRLFLLQLPVLRSVVAVGTSDSVSSFPYALGLALELLLKEGLLQLFQLETSVRVGGLLAWV